MRGTLVFVLYPMVFLYRVYENREHVCQGPQLGSVLKQSKTYSVSKSSPPKNFCNINSQAKYISVKFCQCVASLQPKLKQFSSLQMHFS